MHCIGQTMTASTVTVADGDACSDVVTADDVDYQSACK